MPTMSVGTKIWYVSQLGLVECVCIGDRVPPTGPTLYTTEREAQVALAESYDAKAQAAEREAAGYRELARKQRARFV